ncbi:YoaK family protein [Anaerotignum sp. MB30-C6]|uniref:YoaK family protein n=1 Tax=Anaerotignum sp. MB30-C6 TaxID=3070814 RepID=UPI0027DBFD73|nr:YoaK family protein [Anaerotignum sp. MB30-C6]WMI79872.1 YoaK family protein [Anaerotignum sp. MB30-C6]
MKQWNSPISESFRIGAILAFAGGFFDAYTFIARGGVFANAQTGNMILLAIQLVQGNFLHALYYLIPIFAFVCGIFLVEFIKRKFGLKNGVHWRQRILVIEILVLIFVAFLPIGKGDIFANVLISFICAMQVQSFRTIHGLPYATTMCTGNLRSGTEQLVHLTFEKDGTAGKKALLYFSIIFVFICGAAVGAMVTPLVGAKSVLFCCVLLAIAFFMLFFQQKGKEISKEC